MRVFRGRSGLAAVTLGVVACGGRVDGTKPDGTGGSGASAHTGASGDAGGSTPTSTSTGASTGGASVGGAGGASSGGAGGGPTPVCGDGIVDLDEQCDLVPPAALDGCIDPGEAGECTVGDFDPATYTCPGPTVPIPPGTTVFLGSTIGAGDDLESACSGFGGADTVYALVPSIAGVLTVTIGLDPQGADYCTLDVTSPFCWDSTLSAASGCGAGATEITCSGNPSGPQQIVFPVAAGTPYYVIVDGYSSGSFGEGPYYMQVQLQ